MIDKICMFLTNKIRKEMPDIDDEKAEVINYGLQNLIGEIPKILIMLVLAYVLGIFKLALFTFLALFIYKGASGGVHLKTHIGCIIMTNSVYCGNAYLSSILVLPYYTKIALILLIFLLFNSYNISLYSFSCCL